MNHYTGQSAHGFSLIELIIFIGILSFFFVTSAAITTFSVQNMTANEHRLVATQYANTLLSWIRAQKESDWNTFISSYSSGIAYCFSDPITVTKISDEPTAPCSSAFGSPAAIYTREATLTNVSSTQVSIDIKVHWSEPGGAMSVPLNSVLTLWQ